ncbi:hypothetical protein [Phenylobacterium sp.]|uniref:hypothetical protein n=1 Tax=Phenylobacterium sp. TaxID=1871053 RepID=UPI002D0AACB9|nr:hypothetical protein [Phenylobacterium sp.]HLZ76362.1 hypothetical protein [Phenylobacterium sp.]
MSQSKDPRTAVRQPTPYADLNAVLVHLVDGARTLLGDNFVGAYLQGRSRWATSPNTATATSSS